MQATIRLDTQHHAGPVDPRIFSGFLEHLGRAVYEGVYDPGNPLSDEQGFRRDVIDALKPLKMPLVRYPGGNFVSAYDWRDGVGPREKRPVRNDFAWHSIEPNTFGTDEFVQWCGKLGTAPHMAVNLGTAGAREAAALLEYCNLPAGTCWADQRAANGHREPYGIKLWCMGNEMDGEWQAGHMPAREYAQRANQASRLMKGLDNTIQTVACGSSYRGIKTYLEWDREVLEYCWETVDYISVHRYSGNKNKDSAWFLAEGVEIERIIDDYRGLLGYVRGLKRSEKRVYISFDEWNVCYRSSGEGGWRKAPPLLEEIYNLEDALVNAQFLNAFVRNADLVKIACIAQIVNVIAPIMTRKDGVLIQSIYYPSMWYAQYARGNALKPVVSAPVYKAGSRGETSTLDVSVTHDAETKSAAIFLVNRSQEQDLDVKIVFADAKVSSVAGVEVLTGPDLTAANTWENPSAVKPAAGKGSVEDGAVMVKMPRQGLAVARVKM